jgi:hypothetical protein
MKKIYLLFLIAIITLAKISAQDMDSLMNSLVSEPITYTSATFKATRIINGHSVERMKAGQLDFRIHHRFGQLNTGYKNFWGLDQSSAFFSLEYGITDRLMVGIGRATYQKTYSGFLKYALLRQCKGDKNIPLTVTLLAGSDTYTTDWENPDSTNYTSSRFAYTFQILVARKFSERLSLQLSPTMIHRNLVKEITDPNDIFACGIGGRFKLTKRLSINSEYFYAYRPPITGVDKYPNSLSVGIDLETGGHVFQIMLTNSLPMFERGYILETTGHWLDGDIHLGFNISRVFSLKK